MPTEQSAIGRNAVKRWLAAVCALAAATIGLTLSGSGNTAHAAVPDRFGFVLWNGAATVGSGTWPAATTVSVLGPGRYLVKFAGQAAAGGTAHVTAINSAPHWCQLNNFTPSGADELVTISCYKVGGVPDPTAFSAIFDASSGPASSVGSFGYVNSQPSGTIISQYNSALLANSVIHTGVGLWTVKLPGLATPGPIDGSLQSTAVSPQIPARCKIASWSSGASGQVAQVACFNAGGAPLDTQFTLTYQYLRSLYGAVVPPKYFGYLWNVPPVGPISTNYNNPLGPGANSVSVSGVGLSIVKFPMLAVLPDDIQVTAAGTASDFCGLDNIWTHSGADTIVRNVNCFNNAGAPVSVGSLVSDNSLH
jgi:hypothetical protein